MIEGSTEDMRSNGESVTADNGEDIFAGNQGHSQSSEIDTAAQGIGGVATEDTTKIPISYEDTIKGPAGDDDPVSQQWRDENWVKDKNKAHEMAIAEDEHRTEAVAKRTTAKMLSRHSSLYDQSRRGRGYRRMKAERELRRLKPKLDELSQHPSLEDSWAQRYLKDPEFYHNFTQPFELDGRLEDRMADELGEWAGHLYDRKLTEEFKDKHPDVEFSPKGLAQASRELNDMYRLMDDVEDNIEFFDQTRPGDLLWKFSDRIPEILEELPAKQAEYLELMSKNPSMSDIGNFYKNLERQRLEKLKEKAEQREELLNYIAGADNPQGDTDQPDTIAEAR